MTVVATADVFCVFAEEAACGILAFLPVVAVKEGGRRFFQVGLAMALSALVLGPAIRALGGAYGDALKLATLGGAVLGLLFGIVALKVLAGQAFENAKLWIRLAALATLATIVAEAIGLDRRSPLPAFSGGRTALSVLSVVTGAALLGTVTLAMTLGHFYLTMPRLTIDPLKRLVNGYLASILLRSAIAGAVLALVWNVESSPGRSFLMDEATILAPRVLFGLVGPLILCFLTRGTVAIKSTQSATGILYGATVFVVFGELAASWLAVARGVPL
jgi:hypothetical protein